MRRGSLLYVRLDEDILEDPEMQELIEERGYEGFGLYLALLTVMRRYEKYGFMIPYDKLGILSRKTLGVPEENVLSLVSKCLGLGFFEESENALGERFFYSPRRRAELFEQVILRDKQRKAAEETNKKLGRGEQEG